MPLSKGFGEHCPTGMASEPHNEVSQGLCSALQHNNDKDFACSMLVPMLTL